MVREKINLLSPGAKLFLRHKAIKVGWANVSMLFETPGTVGTLLLFHLGSFG